MSVPAFLSRPPVNAANVDRLRKAIESCAEVGEFLPAVYVVEPTSRCNINCIMCPNHRLPEDSLGGTDPEAWRQVLTKIAPYAELVMLYFMGEVTLHPEFPDLMRIARETITGRLVLSTNATELSMDKRRAILESIDLLIICIDRWNQESYERIRVGSRFNEVVANGEALLRERGNADTPAVIVKTLDIRLPGETEEQLVAEADAFSQYWAERGAIPLHGWLNTWAGQMAGLRKLALHDTPYALEARTPCADLWFKMVINWKGEVVLCCHDWSYSEKLGSLHDSSLEEIWQHDGLAAIRRQHGARNFDVKSLCAKCREWGEPDELEGYLSLDADALYRVF